MMISSYNRTLPIWIKNTKKEVGVLYKNLVLSIQLWVNSHLDEIFYFQDVEEINGIQILFTIGI